LTAGIAAQWSNPKFYVTHEKSIVVDEKAALVATFNLMEKYFTLTRDYGIITDNPYHVAQIVEVFNADWEHLDWDCSAYEGLLWSNSNSRYHMAQFIDTATERLDVQHPKYVDAVISSGWPQPLIAASRCMSSAVASTASANGTFSTPSPRCGH
jgi:phosphatidylserine/phosphatidylglycerophosphate/cardiolipin synthase-like enzyme